MDDFERLRDIIDADDALQAELLAQTDTNSFIAALTRVADRYELIVTEERIWQALEEGRAVWYATWA